MISDLLSPKLNETTNSRGYFCHCLKKKRSDCMSSKTITILHRSKPIFSRTSYFLAALAIGAVGILAIPASNAFHQSNEFIASSHSDTKLLQVEGRNNLWKKPLPSNENDSRISQRARRRADEDAEEEEEEDADEEEGDEEENNDNNDNGENNDEDGDEDNQDDGVDQENDDNNGEQDEEQDDEVEDENNDDDDNSNDDGEGENDDDENQDDQDDQVDDDYGFDDYYSFEDPVPKLNPEDLRTIIGYTVAAIALTLGASGGVGGAGIVVPAYVLAMELPLKAAVPVGAVTVLGGSLASTLLNLRHRHPLCDRPIIDWDLVLVMEPLTLIGTLLGTMLHRILSSKVLVVLLVLLLSVIAHTTLSKAMRMYQAEKRYIRLMLASQSPQSQGLSHSHRNLSVTWGHNSDSPPEKKASHPARMNAEEKLKVLIQNPDFVTLRSNLEEEEKFTPSGKILAIVLMLTVLSFLNIMVGGGAYNSPWGIRCGGVSFWVVHVIMFAFLIAFAWAAQSYVVARHEIKEIVRFDYVHGDIKWDARSAIIYPGIFISAGLFAGTLGVGGGVITVPIMLTMGVHPSIASATSSAMILFTSFASITSYTVFELVLWDFALVGFFIGFFSAFTGQLIMRNMRQARSASGKDFERNSYTAFAIGGVVLLSALLMTLQYVFYIVEQEEDDDAGGLCDGLRL